MATDKYPHQNVNIPITKARLDALRARGARSAAPSAPIPLSSQGGKGGSRREVRPGEWIDDRVITIGGTRASPSADSPPDLVPDQKLSPGSFDPTKVYAVILSKAALFAGRTLPPGDEYIMAGYAAAQIADSVVSAMVLGDIPQDPDAPPTEA